MRRVLGTSALSLHWALICNAMITVDRIPCESELGGGRVQPSLMLDLNDEAMASMSMSEITDHVIPGDLERRC